MHSRLNISLVVPNELRGEGLKKVLEGCELHVGDVVVNHHDLQSPAVGEGAVPLIVVEGSSDDRSLAISRDVYARWPDSRLVILGQHTGIQTVAAAFRAGVDGYISRAVSCGALVEMLKLVALGEKVVPANVVFELAAVVDSAVARSRDERWKTVDLSPREHETLNGLVQGDANKVISRQLGITEATVKVHVKSILRKLQVANRTQAAVWGAGLVIAV